MPVAHELLPRHAGKAWIAPVESLAAEILVAVGETRLTETHPRCQPTKQLGVRQRLAERRDRRLVELDVQMAVGLVDVQLFHVAARRQQDVGIVGGVGLEEVVYDGEQVVAGKPAHHLARLWGDCQRVAVVDEDRLDRRPRVQQVVADGAHVDDARRRMRHQVGPFERGRVHRVIARGGQQDAAGGVAPGTGERRQAGDRAQRHAAAGGAVDAVVGTDRRWPRAAVGLRQLLDDARLDAADRRHACRRKRPHALGEFREAQGVAGDVVLVEEVVADQHVHQAERQRAVGSRQQGDVLVAAVGGHRPAGVDGDQARTAPPRFLRQAPEMKVGDDAVAAPDEDQPRVDDVLGVEADARTDRRAVAHGAGAGADRPVELRGAETVEETAVERTVAEQPRVAGIAVGDDRLGTMAGDDAAETVGDGVQRLVPADPFEARARPLRADAPQRMQQALRVMDALGVVRHLGAQHAGSRRVIGRAGDLQHAALADRDLECAGVRAVMRTGATYRVADGVFGNRLRHGRVSSGKGWVGDGDTITGCRLPGHASNQQRLHQRILRVLVELDVQPGRHLIGQIEQLATAGDWQQQGLRAFLDGDLGQAGGVVDRLDRAAEGDLADNNQASANRLAQKSAAQRDQ
ncbi:MAG: hypothetical protein AW08_01260 [Candidatus Accumulibacter adjunctus]|uniref:Uncharacterized protein n=1 Tax=Candidatus Accumulibacter adjunctus TaxID=1454001 RepID=A0A011MFD1_9PROT|nr:MAG: hypothetical protein AW08_01260 [Candidatus Accumulibacter adjunctus]